MAKTNFSAGDYVTPDFLEAINGTTAATGHRHTSLNQDGSAPKVNLTSAAEVTGVLPVANYIPGAHTLLGMNIRRYPDEWDVEVATGTCCDANGVARMTLASALTKDITDDWAEGAGNGGFPSGLTLTSGTWYKVFVISDGTTVDAGFDTSVVAANLLADATGYTYWRYVGSVYYIDGTDYIRPWYAYRNNFWWQSVQQDAGATALPLDTTVDIDLSVPESPAIATVSFAVTNSTNSWAGQIWDDVHASYSSGNGILVQGSAGDLQCMQIRAVTYCYAGLQQLHARQTSGALSGAITVRTHGWYDLGML